MNKNKFRKTGVGLLCGALAITGTHAWLKNSETAQKQNVLKAGTAQVVFEDGTNVITLSDNLAIPMTNEYAVANLTPYTFKVTNKGTVDMEYSLTAVNEDSTTIDPSLVMIQLDGRTPITLADANLMSGKKIAAGTSDSHSLIAYIKDTGTINDSLSKVVNFHLELTATQTDMSVLPTITTSYANVEKSQIATSITANGETKNVEVYNIEGDSKTELLNKLQESGLANPSDVDALVEVKGEDYDGLNSTATFDVSTVANPGDTVVILHFNETTQEWEYIGEEIVAENNTVSGDFTSYSPVAFVVISNNSGSEGGSSISGVEADGSVLINETNFPDAKFREYVVTNFDTDSDGRLTLDERNAVTRIDVSYSNITSLKGVEYFTSLEWLLCIDNQLTTLDVSKNTELTYLSCSNNQLTTLSVSSNTTLTQLHCSNNQLSTLDVSNNTALTDLSCDNNQLTTLDVSKNTALTSLSCGNNQLSALDVSNNVTLTFLECSHNLLIALDVSKNTSLTNLGCGYNQLMTLDISSNTALISLGCYGNQLTTLDVSNNTALTDLSCDNNQLTSLDVSKNTALTDLECSSNQLTTLDVSKNTALTSLGCGENQLTSLNVSNNTALMNLYCRANRLTSLDVSNNTALKYLYCSENQLTSLDVSKNTALTYLYCNNNQLSTLDVSNNTTLTGLGCGFNQLSALDVSKNISLRDLDCGSNQLTSLNVSNNTALDTLRCQENQLTALDLTHNPSLNSSNVSVDDTVSVTYAS